MNNFSKDDFNQISLEEDYSRQAKKAFKDGKKDAVDAIIASKVRHRADNEAKNRQNNLADRIKYKRLAAELGDAKAKKLEDLTADADKSEDQISVDIRDDKGNTKAVTADFNNIGHMSLHVLKGQSKILDQDREGRMQSTGYGENNDFFKAATNHEIREIVKKKFEAEKKKYNIKEETNDDSTLESFFSKSNLELNESEFSDDLHSIYGDSFEVDKISNVLNDIKDIRYGFINKQTGEEVLDRDWIHGCKNLGDFYDPEMDPTKTIERKIGICQDQSLATEYLFKKYYPELQTQLYALIMPPFGHCVFCFKDNDQWYHLENSWNKEKGLHGPFSTQAELEDHLRDIYIKHHGLETTSSPTVIEFEQYQRLKNGLNEAVNVLPELI